MEPIYKPNHKNEGCACSFNIGKDGDVFINMIKQFSWDENKKTGSFADNAKNEEKNVSIKLNQFEMGAIIQAIRNQSEFSAFHSFGDNKTQIKFTPWTKKDGTKAFGLSVTRNSTDKFKIPIELGEAEVIKTFLAYCLNRQFHNAQKEKQG